MRSIVGATLVVARCRVLLRGAPAGCSTFLPSCLPNVIRQQSLTRVGFLEESQWERPGSRRGGVERGGDACIALAGYAPCLDHGRNTRMERKRRHAAAATHSQRSLSVYFIASVAAIGGLLFGYDTGVISGALLFLKQSFALNATTQEITVSAVLVGAIIGSILAGRLNDVLGRKKTLLLLAVIFTLASHLKAPCFQTGDERCTARRRYSTTEYSIKD